MSATILDDLTNAPLLTKQDRYRIRHARRGLCCDCSNPAAPGYQYCHACRATGHAAYLARYKTNNRRRSLVQHEVGLHLDFATK